MKRLLESLAFPLVLAVIVAAASLTTVLITGISGCNFIVDSRDEQPQTDFLPTEGGKPKTPEEAHEARLKEISDIRTETQARNAALEADR
jgi:hypothetical protein